MFFRDTKLGSCCRSQQNRKFLVSSAAFSNSLHHATSAYLYAHTYTHATRHMMNAATFSHDGPRDKVGVNHTAYIDEQCTFRQ